jgi:exodeoxyribonuclease VII large subunit
VAEERRYFELTEITRRVEHYLAPALARSFWLTAEVSSGRERGGAFYCDLIQSDEGNVVAQMRCTIWARDLARMRSKFARAGLELSLQNGTRIGLECRLQYHPRYGLSLAGLDMDPAFALGELELRRRRILERLMREELLELNRGLPVPLLPNKIVLITSRGSAADRDFTTALAASGFGFRVYRADALMQGEQTEPTIQSALEAATHLPADLVVIARGGGSKTDLAWLDNEQLARRIASFPRPVWTAIGHETDSGVLDAVAGRAFNTPTAAAEELVARFEAVDVQLGDAAARLRGIWELRRRAEVHRLEHSTTGLRQGTRKLLEARRVGLEAAWLTLRAGVSERLAAERGAASRLRHSLGAAGDARLRDERARLRERRGLLAKDARRCLERAQTRLGFVRGRFDARLPLRRIEEERRGLAERARALRAADPRTALARGFALVYGAAGGLLRSVAEVEVGQPMLTRLADGEIESRVQKIQEGGDD